MNSQTPSQRTSFLISFDANIYTLNTIKKSLYKFIEYCYFDIEKSDTQYNIKVNLIHSAKSDIFETLPEQIINEVLDQDLRETILNETITIRNLILANAFSNTTLI